MKRPESLGFLPFGPIIAAIVAAGCTGTVGAGDDAPGPGTAGSTGSGGSGGALSGGTGGVVPPPPAGAVFFQTAVKRLTKRELQQTVLDLTGIDLGAEVNNLPE